MAAHYLEFERPIGELETKIEELSKLSDTAGPGAFDAEVDALRQRVAEMRRVRRRQMTRYKAHTRGGHRRAGRNSASRSSSLAQWGGVP